MKNTKLNTEQLKSLNLATAYLDALEDKNAEAISDLFADNVYHCFPYNVTGEPTPWTEFNGKAEDMEYMKTYKERFSKAKFLNRKITVGSDGATVFIEAEGDLVGPKDKPYNNIYVFKIVTEGEKIVKVYEYANPIPTAQLLDLPIGEQN